MIEERTRAVLSLPLSFDVVSTRFRIAALHYCQVPSLETIVTIELVLPPEGQSIVKVNCSDTVYGVQLVAMNEIVTSCVSCKYQLWNFTTVHRLIATKDDAHKLAMQGHAIPSWAALETILLVGEHDSLLELAMTYQRYTAEWVDKRCEYQLLTFPNLNDASSWIENRDSASSTSLLKYGRSASTSAKEKRVGIPPVPHDLDYYLNTRQKETLSKFQQLGWRVGFVRRLAYQNPLVVITNPAGSEYLALKQDGTVARSIELVVRETDVEANLR